MKKLLFFGTLIFSINLVAQTPGGGVTDIDGNSYSTIIIGNQEWMAENLRVGSYNNGDYINVVDNGVAWYQLSTPAACWYNNDSLNNALGNGKLYNWYVVNDSRNICPTNWRVPSDDDWDSLELFIANDGYGAQDGKVLKSTTGWNSNGNGTDIYGFDATPAGFRYDDNNSTFYSIGSMTYYWSSSSGITYDAMYRKLEDVADTIRTNDGTAKYGFSIRCMKDYTGSVGVNVNSIESDLITIFPNPTSDAISIEGIDKLIGLKSVDILSISGRVVISIEGINKIINVGELPSGVYFLRVMHEGGREVLRFVKE